MNRKIIILSIAVLLVAGLILLTNNSNTTTKAQTVKIGAILPLSGDISVIGQEVRKGIELAEQEMSNATKVQMTILYEDTQSLSQTATVNAATKLLNIDLVDAGMTVIYDEGESIMPLFQNQKKPLLFLWDQNQFMNEAGEYMFSNGFSDEKMGENMASFAFSNLGVKKIAILTHPTSLTVIVSDSFAKKIKEFGGSVVFDEQIPLETTDYRSVIRKIQSRTPDGVYFVLVPPNSTQFIKQAAELGMKVSLLSFDALIQDVIDAASNASEGIYFTNIYTEAQKAGELTRKYKVRYGSDPIDVTLVSFGYDGMMKIRDAIEISKKKNISLRDALEEIYGPTRSADRVEKIFQVRNGKPVLVQE